MEVLLPPEIFGQMLFLVRICITNHSTTPEVGKIANQQLPGPKRNVVLFYTPEN